MKEHLSRHIGLLEAFAVLVVSAVLLGLLGRLFWIFDLVAHFRAQYATALALAGLAFLLLDRPRTGAACLLGAVLLGLSLLPWPAPNGTAAERVRLKMLLFNVHTANRRQAEVLEYVRKENADLVLLLEINRSWLNGLKGLEEVYPHRLASTREDNFGIWFLSRLPPRDAEITGYGPFELPQVNATIDVGGSLLRLIGLHTLPPSSAAATESRNRQLLEAAGALRQSREPAILLGDFNLTPFSPWFGEALQRGNLVAAGRGYQPTWLRHQPLFAIPLDHVLVSRSIRVLSHSVGPDLGSDHRPVVVVLALP